MANSRDLIKSAVEQAERNFVNPPYQSSADQYEKWLINQKLVRYDSHSKKISVTLDFCVGRISEVKIIASCKQWEKIYHSIDEQTFGSIHNLLSCRCPKQKKEKLKQYAEENLEGFREDLFHFANAANIVNPFYYLKGKYYRKYEMKSSPYGLNPRSRHELSNMTIRLYTYFQCISKIPSNKWPSVVKESLKRYGIPTSHILNKKIGSILLQEAVKSVIEQYYKLKFSNRFWKTFVEENHIKITRVRKLNLNPEKDFLLKKLFK